MSDDLLAGDRIQQSGHGLFHLVDEFIDDRVELHLHTFSFRSRERLVFELNIETENDCVGCAGQQHVGLVDRPHFLMKKLQVDLVTLDVGEAFGDRFDRALNVTLEHELEGLFVPLLDAGEEMLQGRAPGRLQLLLADFLNALHAELLHVALVLHDDDFVTHVRHVAEADDLAGHAREHLLDVFAAIIDQSLHFAPVGATDEGLAHAQGALAHNDGRDGALAGYHGRFDHGGSWVSLRVGLQFQHLGLESHGVQQFIQACTAPGGDFHAFDFATPVNRCQADVLQLTLHSHDVSGR